MNAFWIDLEARGGGLDDLVNTGRGANAFAFQRLGRGVFGLFYPVAKIGIA